MKLSRIVPLFAFVFIAVGISLFSSHPAYADGTVGGPGGASGGGGSGAPHTRNGYGWYRFDTDGPTTPGGMKSGTWSSVQRSCKAAGADKIYAFIVMTPKQTVSTAIVYNYEDPDYGTYTRYLGNSGNPWRTYGEARAAFNDLGNNGVSTAGFTFGRNVGYFCSDFAKWDVTPTVSINKATATPGDVVTWTHTIRNNGPTRSSGISYGYNGGGGPFGPIALANGGTSTSNSTYTIKQADVGTNVCRATYASPKGKGDNGVINSGNACVFVPYNYKLTPSITTDVTETASVGGTINVTPAMTNAGPTKSQATTWQVTQFVVSPGGAIPHLADFAPNASAPCAYYKTNVVSCASPYNGYKATGVFNASTAGKVVNLKTTLSATSYVVADVPVGSHVCFALSVKPYTEGNATDWNHSKPICIVVSKSPSVQVLGGDLRVGSGFIGNTDVASQVHTRVTIKTNTSYGSWGEYGIIAAGTISGMSSGSAYSGGLVCTTNCSTANMSFANTPTVGNYAPTTKIPDVAAAFTVTPSTPTFSNLGDASQRRLEKASGNVTITGGTINKGDWLVINAPTSTVTIKGDINYENTPLSLITDIPQLVIIANQINIEGNVKNIDAWLIASGTTGTINTCTNWQGANITPTQDISSKICSDSLVINGPVMAKKLFLRRTAGAGTAAQSGDPAEVINLRADAYLWAIAQSSKSARLETTYSADLPPRF